MIVTFVVNNIYIDCESQKIIRERSLEKMHFNKKYNENRRIIVSTQNPLIS